MASIVKWTGGETISVTVSNAVSTGKIAWSTSIVSGPVKGIVDDNNLYTLNDASFISDNINGTNTSNFKTVDDVSQSSVVTQINALPYYTNGSTTTYGGTVSKTVEVKQAPTEIFAYYETDTLNIGDSIDLRLVVYPDYIHPDATIMVSSPDAVSGKLTINNSTSAAPWQNSPIRITANKAGNATVTISAENVGLFGFRKNIPLVINAPQSKVQFSNNKYTFIYDGSTKNINVTVNTAGTIYLKNGSTPTTTSYSSKKTLVANKNTLISVASAVSTTNLYYYFVPTNSDYSAVSGGPIVVEIKQASQVKISPFVNIRNISGTTPLNMTISVYDGVDFSDYSYDCDIDVFNDYLDSTDMTRQYFAGVKSFTQKTVSKSFTSDDCYAIVLWFNREPKSAKLYYLGTNGYTYNSNYLVSISPVPTPPDNNHKYYVWVQSADLFNTQNNTQGFSFGSWNGIELEF